MQRREFLRAITGSLALMPVAASEPRLASLTLKDVQFIRTLIQNGMITPNEARGWLELDPLGPEGDTLASLVKPTAEARTALDRLGVSVRDAGTRSSHRRRNWLDRLDSGQNRHIRLQSGQILKL